MMYTLVSKNLNLGDLKMLNIDDPSVQLAKSRYEGPRKGPKPVFAFDLLLEKYLDSELSIADIARELKTSSGVILYNFQNHFRGLVPDYLKNCMNRLKVARAKQRRKLIADLHKADSASGAALFYKRAKQKKIPCERIYYYKRLMTRFVKTRSKLCYISICNKPKLMRGQSIRRTFRFPVNKITVAGADFIVFVAKSATRTDFYIFTAAELLTFQGNEKVFYVQDVTTPAVNKVTPTEQQSFIEAHRNAWEILKTAV